MARSGEYLTPIAGHKRVRKRLIAPLSAIPNLRTKSWLSDRLLDPLWVALLVTSFERNVALDAIRAAATRVLQNRKKYAKFDGTHDDDAVEVAVVVAVGVAVDTGGNVDEPRWTT